MMNTPMQPQYRGHAQQPPVQRSPHNPTGPRRGPGEPTPSIFLLSLFSIVDERRANPSLMPPASTQVQ